MILIGEKLNSSIPSVLEHMNLKNENKIVELIISQCENKANYLDVNTALTGNEEDTMKWIINLIQNNSDVGIMIDSPNVNIVKNCIKYIKHNNIIINSVTLNERHELIDLAKEYDAGIVALPIGDKMPKSIDERINNSYAVIDKILSKGISPDKIYLDILLETLASDSDSANNAIETLKAVKSRYSNIKTTCGLSNISFGLPKRSFINCSFLACAIYNKLDSAILDNTSKPIMDTIYSTLAVCGNDEYCLDYINYIRDNQEV